LYTHRLLLILHASQARAFLNLCELNRLSAILVNIGGWEEKFEV
jgi:hypothetical protein